MSDRYPLTTTPIRLGPIEVRNRVYFGPHGTPLAVGGGPSEDFAAYSEERAVSGVGLIIHSLAISQRAGIGRACPALESSVGAFSAVAERVHAHGSRIFGQLNYFYDFPSQWEPLTQWAPTLSPSGTQRHAQPFVTRAMSTDDIAAMVGEFAKSARNLRAAGYDGVELHATHGMLHNMFLSPYFNTRSDRYGGSLQNRMRFVLETLEAMRNESGSDFAVGLRYQCDEMLPGGFGVDESREALAVIAGTGLIDFVDLDVSVEPEQSYRAIPNYFLPTHYYKPFVEALRSAAGELPVLSTIGRVTDIAAVERLLDEGVVDMVGMVRALIAEPELLKNALEGHEHDNRRCIGANMCQDRRGAGAFGCAINPASGRERAWGVREMESAAETGRLVVVGGGPAGMEAARVGALRGHSVVLMERLDRLGGQLNLWASIPDREHLRSTVDWYEAQLRDLGVDVRLGVHATQELIEAERPTAVLVATGGTYVLSGESGFVPQPILGADRAFVHGPEAVLAGQTVLAGHVVVLDDEGLNTGVGVAEVLAASGCAVTFVTRLPEPASRLEGTFEQRFIIERLMKLGVRLMSSTYFREIAAERVTVYNIHNDADEQVDDVDAVVLVTMRRQVDDLSAALERNVAQVFPIGDALAPRGLPDATFEGQRFAREVGRAGAPTTFTEAYWTPVELTAFPRQAVPK